MGSSQNIGTNLFHGISIGKITREHSLDGNHVKNLWLSLILSHDSFEHSTFVLLNELGTRCSFIDFTFFSSISCGLTDFINFIHLQ